MKGIWVSSIPCYQPLSEMCENQPVCAETSVNNGQDVPGCLRATHQSSALLAVFLRALVISTLVLRLSKGNLKKLPQEKKYLTLIYINKYLLRTHRLSVMKESNGQSATTSGREAQTRSKAFSNRKVW